MGSTGKAAGGFYSDEAARLALEAATVRQQPAAPASTSAGPDQRYVPPILLQEPQRPPLRPEPAINENLRPARREPVLDAEAWPERRAETRTDVEDRWAAAAARHPEVYPDEDDDEAPGVGRILAWIVLAPWYVAVLAAALGVIGLVARGFLQL